MASTTTTIRTPLEEDQIIISLTEHQTITHSTVRINTVLQVQRDESTDEKDLRTQIKAVLNSFIKADWRFTGINRQTGLTRFETITIAAVARVPESENKMLTERANAASKPGLEISRPVATYQLPTERVREINRDLRVALVQQAQKECDLYNKSKVGEPYRVALIEFADTPAYAEKGMSQSPQRASNVYASNVTPGGSVASAEADVETGSQELEVSERFWAAAQVTLRAGRFAAAE